LIIGKRRPPAHELIGDFDFPHQSSMSYHSS
jgi:hypothetical protein